MDPHCCKHAIISSRFPKKKKIDNQQYLVIILPNTAPVQGIALLPLPAYALIIIRSKIDAEAYVL